MAFRDITIDASQEDPFDIFCIEELSPILIDSCFIYSKIPRKRTSPEEYLSCNCRQSECLKLYCECFAKKRLCGPQCKCRRCKNKTRNGQLRINALNKVLSQNANAFIQDGCNCKRSLCLKKYCRCFQSGQQCKKSCYCLNCRNSA